LTPRAPAAYVDRVVRSPGPPWETLLDLDPLPPPVASSGGPLVGSLTIADLVRSGTVDAELAGLLWLLVDGGVPLTVAGPGVDEAARSERRLVLDGVLDLVPSSRRTIRLAGPTEDFAWLAGAEALGWRRTSPPDLAAADPRTTVVLAGELGALPPADTVGDAARLVVRALGSGYGLAATASGGRLEDVLSGLRRQPIGLTDDELTNLGTVLIVDRAPATAAGPSPRPRVVAAHYLRPLARDVHGHPQRLAPAVLATWAPELDRFEHFAWGIAAELAGRVGRRTGDFEVERERRSAILTDLAEGAAHGPEARPTIRAALERARLAVASGGERQLH
jgi:hypothetical protein